MKDGSLDKDHFTFFFSTNDYEFLMRVYNGFININKDGNFQLFGNNIKIKNFFHIPEKRFDKDEATFKTLFPFLVRKLEDGEKFLLLKGMPLQTREPDKNIEHWKYWEEASEQDFKKALLSSITSLLSRNYALLNASIDNIDIKISNGMIVPILHGSDNQDHLFQMTFPGIKGLLTIRAEPEVLKLIYDIGIGARRSEGFDMLEVVE